MKKTLALLVALALFAAPVMAQSSPAETEDRWTPTLDRFHEFPILGWLIGLVTENEEPEEAPSPEPEENNTLVLDPVDGADEARGVPDPWG